ncbi:TRAP transporter substrate-binding protein [Ancylobacter sp. MQZ15Z-1]|uniref:TRAP transporter substrate-binding protein n=1 Tax=Ancylobacter mangrovi TaxID=2972472 RepID=A0A9X2P9E0_9HYPH|nr:TRAP transporter substrate-binding protein [Ancylobacter mangrovi]MCS0494622.1 TRAP transporter substrate-binding protein [Ancylobacter mangrovi]
MFWRHALAAHALAATAAALAFTTAIPAAEARTVTVATVYGARDVSTQAMEKWGELLAKKTDGRLTINIIPGGTLGGDRELLQQLSSGEIDVDLSSPVVMQYVAPQYQCLEAEYIYENENQGFKVWRGEIGKEASAAMQKQYGIEIAAVGRRGGRVVTANKKIIEPQDMTGLKFRVTNDLRAQVFAAYGAQPAPLPLSELYGALRQGVFDGEENPLSTIYSLRFHEVQPFISLTYHVWTYNLVLVNSAFYDGLGDDRKAFDETLSQALDWLYDAVAKDDARIIAEIKKSGKTEIVEPDVAAFRAKARPVLKAYADKNCKPGLIDQVDQISSAN